MTDARNDDEGVRGRTVLLAGGTSAAGHACARALLDTGARVVVVGSSDERLATMAADLPRAVGELRDRVRAEHGRIDGLLHLVGGWRGGGGLAGQSDDDFAFLLQSVTALRHVSRAFDDDLRASPAGRLAIVSSNAVERPLAGGANYATAKAASETWVRAVAQGYAKAARDAGREPTAAAVIFRVTSLSGLEDALAASFIALWDDDATAWNDVTIGIDAPA